jgi:hypothetical protein
MHGWLKVAKKHWPKCLVNETENEMQVRSEEDFSLLVCARRAGGGMTCAQKETHAKYPLMVLQSDANLSLYEQGKEIPGFKEKESDRKKRREEFLKSQEAPKQPEQPEPSDSGEDSQSA